MDFTEEYINKKQLTMSVHHSTHPTCQECYSQGLMPERIDILPGGMVTAAFISPFYDSEGKHHFHDTNRHTEDLKCSNGHEFTIVKPHKCWCGWKQEIEEMQMLATLVATNGNWGAYVATQEMLEKKEQPLFLAPYERPSEAVEAIEEQLPNQFLGFTDYGSFWEQIVYAGIEKPETMPHREPYPKEIWKKARAKTCLTCKQIV